MSIVPVRRSKPFLPHASLSALTIVAMLGCASEVVSPVAPGFLGGTANDHEIGVVVNSLGKTLALFQLGSPTTH